VVTNYALRRVARANNIGPGRHSLALQIDPVIGEPGVGKTASLGRRQ